jgi:hypothetical protein
MNSSVKLAAVLCAMGAVGVFATACGSDAADAGSSSGSTTSAGSSSSVASSASTAAPAGSSPAITTPAAATTAAAGPSMCTQAQLTATTGGTAKEDVQVLAIVFTNHSASSCTVTGYPGVAGLNAAGTQTAQAVREPGLATPTVTLAPGASVSALVKTAKVNTAPDCEFAGGLAVTPPNTSTTVKLTDPDDKLNSCSLTVTPIVSGTNGGDTNIQ